MGSLGATTSAITGLTSAGLTAGIAFKTFDFVGSQTKNVSKSLPKSKKKLPKAKSRLPRSRTNLPTFADMYPNLSRKKRKSKRKGRMAVDNIFDFNF